MSEAFKKELAEGAGQAKTRKAVADMDKVVQQAAATAQKGQYLEVELP